MDFRKFVQLVTFSMCTLKISLKQIQNIIDNNSTLRLQHINWSWSYKTVTNRYFQNIQTYRLVEDDGVAHQSLDEFCDFGWFTDKKVHSSGWWW